MMNKLFLYRKILSKPNFIHSILISHPYTSIVSSYLDSSRSNITLNSISSLQFNAIAINPLNLVGYRCIPNSYFSSSSSSSRTPSRTLRKRINKRRKAAFLASLDKTQFQRALSKLLPRFKPEELHDVIMMEDDPLVCLELFNWASQQPRFTHDVSTFHITIKKLGVAKMYEEMDNIATQVLEIPTIGSEALFNSMIYFYTEARKLSRAVIVYRHMRNSKNVDCWPSIRTYNLLFAAFLSRRSNSYINHMYMETIRGLFRQMIDDGVDPDIFCLNSMIKGYVLSLHINDALRIFHQMGVVYDCLPNSYSYDYLIHGLCAQGRTENARKLCNQMKEKGVVPSSKSYNSLVNALALEGEVDGAVNFLREMIEHQRSVDFITFRTVLDEICKTQRVEDAVGFLKELQEKDIVDGLTYRELQCVLEDNFGNRISRNRR